MDFERPLWTNAVDAAVASALEDSRFSPVAPAELDEITIEISILDQPEELPEPGGFDVRRHGIIVQKGWRHALLLPKVAQEQDWDATKTLEMVCEKAGLRWHRELWFTRMHKVLRAGGICVELVKG